MKLYYITIEEAVVQLSLFIGTSEGGLARAGYQSIACSLTRSPIHPPKGFDPHHCQLT